MNWNRDISAAPRGRTVKVDRMVARNDGKVSVEYEAFERDYVILATKCGKVTQSYWLPNEDRWCMLKKGEDPIAWMPWPEWPENAIAKLHEETPSEFERLCKE